jgi:hypothetical protein
LQQTFAKLATLHAKNSFSLAIVTGNLFSEDETAVADLISGKIIVPLPVYFTVGSDPLPQAIIEKIEKHEEVFMPEQISISSLLIYLLDLP